jgi:hypothetical protein
MPTLGDVEMDEVAELMFGRWRWVGDGWSSELDAYIMRARRADGTKVRCLIPQDTFDDEFPDERDYAAGRLSSETAFQAMFTALATSGEYERPRDHCDGLDLILTSERAMRLGSLG